MMPALSNLFDSAGQIRTYMMPFAFVLCILGIGEMAWRAGSDTKAILGVILKVTIIVALIAGYPTIMNKGMQAFQEMRQKFTNAQDAKFIQLLTSRIQNQPSDSWTDLGKIVPAAVGYFFQGIGRFMMIVLNFFQQFAIAGLIAVSPLLLGFLFFSPTQSFGIQFAVTSFTVMLWYLGICLVDIVIVAISDMLFAPITAGGIAQVAQNAIVVQNWLLFPFIMAFASIVTLFFYLSVPFVAGAIMKGASGTTSALSAGINNTLQAVGFVAGAGATVAGAAATFGGSAAAQAAVASGKAAAGAASAASSSTRISNDLAGSSAGGGGAASAGGSVLSPPEESGGSIFNPENPAMVAQQTSPESFTVTDHSKGTVSRHRGSLATPHAAQAAFNSHASKAKPSSSEPDNTNP
jgi:hypothetical protein